jgi:hypothetical protein
MKRRRINRKGAGNADKYIVVCTYAAGAETMPESKRKIE